MVFSRMNLGQINEAIVSKAVWKCNENILKNPNKTAETIHWLNENIVKYLGDHQYYLDIKNFSKQIKNDNSLRENFIDNISKTNLFIEAPAFSEIDLRSLINKVKPKTLEKVIIKKELLQYMKDKLKVMSDYTFTSDITIDNTLVSMVYIQKLYKIANKIISSRDLGPIKAITGQPVRGKGAGGGSRVGQMELNL